MRLSDFDKAPENELTESRQTNDTSGGVQVDAVAVTVDAAVTADPLKEIGRAHV